MADRYRRILLKLSGEALEIGLVIGGGNIFRGAELVASGLDRVSGDQMGMLATVINALALQSALATAGCDVRVLTAFPVGTLAEPFDARRAVAHLTAGRVVIFAAGTGNPFFTTDSAASLRAIEIAADVLIKATKVDGVYSADPVRHPDAEHYPELSYDEVIRRELAVMDITAVVLCRDHRLPLRVMNVNRPGALQAAVRGETVGTLVTEGGER